MLNKSDKIILGSVLSFIFFVFFFGIILLVLRSNNTLNISYFWAVFPFWFPLALSIFIGLVYFAVAISVCLIEYNKKK